MRAPRGDKRERVPCGRLERGEIVEWRRQAVALQHMQQDFTAYRCQRQLSPCRLHGTPKWLDSRGHFDKVVHRV